MSWLLVVWCSNNLVNSGVSFFCFLSTAFDTVHCSNFMEIVPLYRCWSMKSNSCLEVSLVFRQTLICKCVGFLRCLSLPALLRRII
jgi:hypothetical protein